MDLRKCRCGRTGLVWQGDGERRDLCPQCGGPVSSCACVYRGNNECACGFPVLVHPIDRKARVCRKCGQHPDRCKCIPREVAEYRDPEMFMDSLQGGDPIAFAMQKVAERVRARTAGS
jgi:hypothetical protein